MHKELTGFERTAARRLAALSEQLRQGTWRPHPVVPVSIAKTSGGYRQLGVPVLEDRVVERALLDVLDPIVDPLLLPWSFAYRRGLGVRDALFALVHAREDGATWVVRADVEDCFPSIPRWPVITRLREVVPDPQLTHLVLSLVNRPVLRGRAGAPAPGEHGGSRGRGLHQGSALSPLLCNLYLDALDRALLDAGLQPIRYADDIAIPVAGRAAGESALDVAARALESLELRLNRGKSRVVSFDEGVDFLGETVTSTTGPGVDASAHPLETTVYVDRPGSLLRTRGERLRVEHGGEVLLSLNLRRIRQVVCVGRVGMTTAFLHRAMREGVEVCLLDSGGGLLGTVAPPERSDVSLRMRQYGASTGGATSLALASRFVVGKIGNMRISLLRAARRHPLDGFAEVRDRLEAARASARAATTVPGLMGVEGAATREYFRTLARILGDDWGFESRQRRPPRDPVNAMLSLGYTLLTSEAVAAATMAGLDPYAGFLHKPAPGRPSLALDLIEEFRPVVVDAVVLRLASTGMVTPADFTTDPDQGCRLSDSGRETFYRAYEKRMLTLFTHPGAGRRVSYRVALGLQAKSLAKAIRSGDAGAYVPVAWK